MKKLIILLLMVLPLTAFAQETKIAYVQVGEVFSLMPEVKEVDSKLAAERAAYEKEFKQLTDEYQKKFSDYVAQQDSLTENIKLRRQQELQDMNVRMENFQQQAEQGMAKLQQELLGPVQKKLQDAIKAVAEEKGYTYIIDPQALLYVAPNAIDATPFVKAKLGLK